MLCTWPAPAFRISVDFDYICTVVRTPGNSLDSVPDNYIYHCIIVEKDRTRRKLKGYSDKTIQCGFLFANPMPGILRRENGKPPEFRNDQCTSKNFTVFYKRFNEFQRNHRYSHRAVFYNPLDHIGRCNPYDTCKVTEKLVATPGDLNFNKRQDMIVFFRKKNAPGR